MVADEPDVVELDTDAIAAWITENTSHLSAPFRWTRLVGGHSNLTYLIEDATTQKAVVRRAPLGELQPGAHNMAREFRVVSALWPTAVPVAQPFNVCDDPAVAGAPFYVMGHVPGRALPSSSAMIEWLPTVEGQRRAAESFVDVLAELHTLDVDQIGLGDLAKRDDYAGRQLRAWYRSWTSSADAAGYDDPRIHELHHLLEANKPAQGPPRLVHGDYGFHNCLIADDGSVAAVVDWEVCTLGDALSDLAFILNRWSVEGDVIPGREGLTMPRGFMSRDEVIERYASRTGADLSALDYYVTLNHWRSACIVHGVYTRYVRGQKSSDGINVEGFRTSIGQRLTEASKAAERLHAP